MTRWSMAWNRSVRTHYNQIAQGGERDNLFFALGFYLYLILWYGYLFNKTSIPVILFQIGIEVFV